MAHKSSKKQTKFLKLKPYCDTWKVDNDDTDNYHWCQQLHTIKCSAIKSFPTWNIYFVFGVISSHRFSATTTKVSLFKKWTRTRKSMALALFVQISGQRIGFEFSWRMIKWTLSCAFELSPERCFRSNGIEQSVDIDSLYVRSWDERAFTGVRNGWGGWGGWAVVMVRRIMSYYSHAEWQFIWLNLQVAAGFTLCDSKPFYRFQLRSTNRTFSAHFDISNRRRNSLKFSPKLQLPIQWMFRLYMRNYFANVAIKWIRMSRFRF